MSAYRSHPQVYTDVLAWLEARLLQIKLTNYRSPAR